MINSKKYFLPDGGVDNDSAHQTISENDFTNLQNCLVGINEFGKSNRLQNRAGTLQITNNKLPPYGTMFTFGSCVDAARNYIVYADYCSHGDHGIYAYDTVTGTTYAVIYDSQVIGGLNFSKSYRIDRNMYVVGDLLFWTDNLNEPRCINYIAGIKSNQSSYVTDVAHYFFPIKYQSSTLIVRPPIYVLTAAKQTDSGFSNNFIALNSYQFSYQYVFRDGQSSALSDSSLLIPCNFKADTYNNILVKVPFAEFIDNEINQINFCVKYGNTGKTFIIKTWNRSNTEDLRQINSHNLGLVQLQYQFYDNVVGIAVDDVTANTPYSNVPLKTKTIAPAKNRLFLANNTLGYNTPSFDNSLSATSGTSGSDTVIFKSGGTIKLSVQFFDRFKRKCGATVKSVTVTIADRTYTQTTFTNAINWALSNTNASSQIPDWAYYYQILWTKNLIKSFYIQGMTQEMYYATKDNDGVYSFKDTTYNVTTTAALAVSLSAMNALGIGYTYQDGDLAVIYRYTDTNYTSKVLGVYGNYVLLSPVDIGKIYNNYSFTLLPFSYVNAADTAYVPCTANNPVTSDEITVKSAPTAGLNPDPPTLGVDNYIIDNPTFGTRTFTVTGTATFTITGASVTYPNFIMRAAITDPPASDATYVDLFSQAAVAGSYTKTFSVTVTIPAGYNRVSLIAFCPDVVTITLTVGSINFTQAGALNLFEIFTPNKEALNEQYYGYGDIYSITNPTENTRVYGTTSGTIVGDSFKITRTINTSTSYYPEAMSPNDLTWQLWQRSLSFFNTVDYIGQQQKKDYISFSDPYVTNVNGLSSFQPLNQTSIGVSSGGIQKLVITNKQNEIGSVMLILTQNECLSAYLGEAQVVGASKNAFLSVSDGVIGTINELRGNSGTVNPESVIAYLGEVYWVDANNGWITQYSSNGLFPISSFKMSRFWQRYLKNYNAASTGNLDNINGFHHISMMIDPFHKRVNVVLPGLIYENYAATLPSYSSVPSYATSIVNRFDAYDELPKIMCFDFINNRWKESLQGLPEWSEYVGDKMYGFKAGLMYIHDADTSNYNKFYGTQYPVRLMFTPNLPPSGVKDVFDMSIEGNTEPNFTVLYTTYPYTQITDLTVDDFNDLEGVLYARFYRDRLSPNSSGTADEKLYTGDVIQSQVPQVMVELQAYTDLMYINAINIGWALSRGQQKIVNK